MASSRTWAKVIFSIVFTLFAFGPIPETSCASYALNHKGLLPAGKTVGNSLSVRKSRASNLNKQKKKKVLSVSKNLFKKLAENQAEMEKEADREVAETVFPVAHKVNQQQREQIVPPEFQGTPRRFPESIMKSNLSATHLEEDREHDKKGMFKPYYDCDLFQDGNAIGQADIKPDPFDCACFYYCDRGIHKGTCCPWPLLWNQGITTCDWYWKVYCYTSDFWKK